jgi:hypothetical protein
MSWIYNVGTPLLANADDENAFAALKLHVSKRIRVTDLYGEPIGYVTVTGTSRVAEMSAMERASKLAARTLGYDWAVAWQTWGEEGGTIDVSAGEGWNAGKRIARWAFV